MVIQFTARLKKRRRSRRRSTRPPQATSSVVTGPVVITRMTRSINLHHREPTDGRATASEGGEKLASGLDLERDGSMARLEPAQRGLNYCSSTVVNSS